MNRYTICGVNEHYNFPWRYAIENGFFSAEGIDLEWTESKGGTGEMTRLLREKKTDLAVLLTEGLFQEIMHHNSARMVQSHAKSPLHWGIHVHRNSSIQSPDNLAGKTFAISRFGSGSHLMALVHAREKGWNENDLRFVEVGHLEGGLQAVENGKADVFLWEKYTTAPFLQQHHLRYAGDVITPWPGFVLAAGIEMCKDHPKDLHTIATVITNVCRQLMQDPQLPEHIAKRHHLDTTETQKWLADLEWNQQPGCSQEEQQSILHGLCKAGIVPESSLAQADHFFFTTE